MLKNKWWQNMLIHLALIIVTLLVLLPILWMFITSIQPTADVITFPPRFVPENPTFENYIVAWRDLRFGRSFRNSLIVSLSTTVVSLFIGSLGGYALARFNMKGERAYLYSILLTRMFPAIVFLVPFFILMNRLRLVDSFGSLIIGFTVFTLPLCVWMLRGFFRNIPVELEEAAMIDGCTRLAAFRRIIIPLAAPGMAATGIFSFILAWNEFMFANTLIMSADKRVLTVQLVTMIDQYAIEWNSLMAGSILTTIPIIGFFLFMQNYITGGLTEGSIK